jgi:hypothetical protein
VLLRARHQKECGTDRVTLRIPVPIPNLHPKKRNGGCDLIAVEEEIASAAWSNRVKSNRRIQFQTRGESRGAYSQLTVSLQLTQSVYHVGQPNLITTHLVSFVYYIDCTHQYTLQRSLLWFISNCNRTTWHNTTLKPNLQSSSSGNFAPSLQPPVT